MANIVPVTVSYEVSEPVKGQYEVKEATEEQQVDLNSWQSRGICI